MAANVMLKWEGDVLDRKPYGDFLYKLAIRRYSANYAAPGCGSLCIAIDAEWGAGKTFFVKRWADDIAALQHPVIHFDAWVNDLAEDPLLGFMAQMQRDLEPWLKSLPVAPRVKAAAGKKLKQLWKQAPRAVLPAFGLIARAIAKQAIGDPSQVIEALGSIGFDEVSEVTQDGLEKFFDVALQSHSDKQSAIVGLKKSIEDLLMYLGEQEQVSLPMFVFIDELDRCRPDYAIRLLEGVKHLFDAYGLCFVFSTNLAQLSESAKAVYGAGFDGYRYLKRFFAFEYRLPEPDHAAFAVKLALDSTLAGERLRLASAIPSGAGSRVDHLAQNFALVARAFDLDLRSQEQVFRLADAASAGLDDGQYFYCLYMFVLASAFHEGPERFALMAPQPNRIADMNRSLSEGIGIPFTREDERGRRVNDMAPLSKVIGIYHRVVTSSAKQTLRELLGNPPNNLVYPDRLNVPIYEELNQQQSRGEELEPSVAGYYKLMRAAGQTIEALTGGRPE